MTREHMTLVPEMATDSPGAWLRAGLVDSDGGVIMHVAGHAEDLPRLAGVIAALAERAAFHQIVLDAGAGRGTRNTLADLSAPVDVVHLTAAPTLPEDVVAALAACDPTVLMVHVDDHAGVCCALAAARLGISIVRVGGPAREGIGRVVASLSDLLLVHAPDDAKAGPAAHTPERVTVIGNPLVDLVLRDASDALALAAWRKYAVAPGTYDLVVLTGSVAPAEVVSVLSEAGDSLLVEAPAGYAIPGARPVMPVPSFFERLSLERTARAIFTDSARVLEEAATLGVPCHWIGAARPLPAPPEATATPPRRAWDRGASARAADALVANFARVRLLA